MLAEFSFCPLTPSTKGIWLDAVGRWGAEKSLLSPNKYFLWSALCQPPCQAVRMQEWQGGPCPRGSSESSGQADGCQWEAEAKGAQQPHSHSADTSLFLENLLHTPSLILCLGHFLCIIIFCLTKPSWSIIDECWWLMYAQSYGDGSQSCPSKWASSIHHHLFDCSLTSSSHHLCHSTLKIRF